MMFNLRLLLALCILAFAPAAYADFLGSLSLDAIAFTEKETGERCKYSYGSVTASDDVGFRAHAQVVMECGALNVKILYETPAGQMEGYLSGFELMTPKFTAVEKAIARRFETTLMAALKKWLKGDKRNDKCDKEKSDDEDISYYKCESNLNVKFSNTIIGLKVWIIPRAGMK